MTSTKHNKIFISNPLKIDEKELEKNLNILGKLEYDEKYSVNKVVELMKKAVPTYRDSKEVNAEKEQIYGNKK